jgi:hypothetical protein
MSRRYLERQRITAALTADTVSAYTDALHSAALPEQYYQGTPHVTVKLPDRTVPDALPISDIPDQARRVTNYGAELALPVSTIGKITDETVGGKSGWIFASVAQFYGQVTGRSNDDTHRMDGARLRVDRSRGYVQHDGVVASADANAALMSAINAQTAYVFPGTRSQINVIRKV